MRFEGKSIDELKVGDSAQWSKTVTEDDIKLFAKATGDFNPVHLDQTYAEKTFFKGRIPMAYFPLVTSQRSWGTFCQGMGPFTFPKK